jgi:diacylglycerol kinase family enzyme
MRVTVVANLRAGGRRMAPFDAAAVELLLGRVAACAGATGELFVTAAARDGIRGARLALDRGADCVVAWGGDGTVNEVASVIAGTGVALGIVPAGSGNGLARELGIPRRPAIALRRAFERETRDIDIGTIGDRVFVNVAGFGLDAHIARLFNQGRARGLSQYVRIAIREVLHYRAQRYAVRWDGGAIEGLATILAFANSRQYGNGACLAPLAKVDDGAVDIVAVEPSTPLRDLWRARRLFTRTILRDPHVRFGRARQAVLSGAALLSGHVDGEPVDVPSGTEVHVRPGALRVRCSRVPNPVHQVAPGPQSPNPTNRL